MITLSSPKLDEAKQLIVEEFNCNCFSLSDGDRIQRLQQALLLVIEHELMICQAIANRR